jgi:hypothetical protein
MTCLWCLCSVPVVLMAPVGFTIAAEKYLWNRILNLSYICAASFAYVTSLGQTGSSTTTSHCTRNVYFHYFVKPDFVSKVHTHFGAAVKSKKMGCMTHQWFPVALVSHDSWMLEATAIARYKMSKESTKWEGKAIEKKIRISSTFRFLLNCRNQKLQVYKSVSFDVSIFLPQIYFT